MEPTLPYALPASDTVLPPRIVDRYDAVALAGLSFAVRLGFSSQSSQPSFTTSESQDHGCASPAVPLVDADLEGALATPVGTLTAGKPAPTAAQDVDGCCVDECSGSLVTVMPTSTAGKRKWLWGPTPL